MTFLLVCMINQMKFDLLSTCVHRTNPKHPADKPNRNGLLCISLQANSKAEPLPELLVAVWQSWPDMVTARADEAEACLRNAFLWEKPGLCCQQLEE